MIICLAKLSKSDDLIRLCTKKGTGNPIPYMCYATSTVTLLLDIAWLYAGHSCVLPQDVKSNPATASDATKMIAFFISVRVKFSCR